MAAPMELYCWACGWGLPSVDPDCLAVLTYARFTGAPLKVHKITNPWRSPSGLSSTDWQQLSSISGKGLSQLYLEMLPQTEAGTFCIQNRGSVTELQPAGSLPALKSTDEGIISDPQQIITHLRKQKFNADYDLSARQAADTLAFVSLLQEKLLPVLIHTFWVDAKNYVEHTRKWYAEAIPFPLNFFLPGRMQKRQLERLHSVCRDVCLESEEELEKELYREARECLTLLSQCLGRQKFFFGDAPASLDAIVFSHLAPLLKAKLPNAKFQQHLKSLPNLCNYCTNILSLYFPWDGGDPPPSVPKAAAANGSDTEEEPYKRRNQVLSVLVGLVAMIGYALLSGIVSIQRQPASHPRPRPIALSIGEEAEEEEE